MTHSKRFPLNLTTLSLMLGLIAGASACADPQNACIGTVPRPADDSASTAATGYCADASEGPYAVGSGVDVQVIGFDGTAYFEADDPSVLEVTAAPEGRAHVTFLAAGRNVLTARSSDDDSVLATLTLRALTPDRVAWTFGQELLGGLPLPATGPLFAVGGHVPVTATYYAGYEQLEGAGILHVGAGPARVGRGPATGADWLIVEPELAGAGRVELTAGPFVFDYDFEAVSADEVATLILTPNADGYAGFEDDGAPRPAVPSVFSQALSNDGRLVLGAPVTWSLDGEALETRGDVFQYELDPAQTRTLEARVGDATLSLPIHASGVDGARVVDGGELLCSASGNPAPGLGMLALVMFALVVISRRRAAHV